MEGSSDPRTDGELLVATPGDPEAFAVFYRRHVRGLLAFFRRRAHGADIAFDLTAETFAAALEAAPRYQLRVEPARGWLYGIAWNKLHEAQRRGRADDAARRALGMAPIVLTDEGIERIEVLTGAAALELLESLPADQRSAVRGRVLEERGYDELAGELGCSPSVVRKRVSRGMAAITPEWRRCEMCDNPVAAVALVGLHGHAGQRRAGPVVPGGQDGGLRAMLSVLRRPQTAVDRRALRRSHELQTPLDDALGGRVDPASARLATITPWHAPVLVAVVNPVTRRGGGHPRSLAQPGLLVFTGEGSGCCATGASVAATGAANYENDGGPPAVARVDVVVPDGVGRVVFHVAAGKGEPTHAIASAVHGNVAAVQTRGSCCAGWSPLMTWYTADGRVLKRVVRFNGGGSVVPPASPTPVRITVRPSAGASRTTFAASFRAPRAGEDYSYKLTGPPGCSAVTGSFATRRELGVRGRRIAIPLSPAPGGRWCAGVWTVSVGLGTHNRSRTISPAGPTFGSARFTVRR